MAEAVDVRLLGPLEILDDTGVEVRIPGSRPRGLLAMLALEAPKYVSADRVIEAVWQNDIPREPEATLQVTVSRLRKLLDKHAIETAANGYRLSIPASSIDHERFTRLARRARQLLTLGQPGKASEAFRQSLAQWRGSALADLRRFDFAEEAARRLEEERLLVVEQLMEAELAVGNHELVVGELTGLVDAFPLRERLWEHLMIALYRGGRQSEALRAFGQMRRILGEELGVEPSKALVDLEERILLHDPGLHELAEAPGREGVEEPEIVIYQPGDLIIEAGSQADSVYWIEQGRVEVLESDDQGIDRVLIELGPGRYFGELASLLGTARTATVRAITPTTTSVHSVESFRRRLGAERAAAASSPPTAEKVWELVRRGQYLRAFDLASNAVARDTSDPELRYLSVLALARSGATEHAIRLYETMGLDSVEGATVTPRLAADIVALAARLHKDMALADLPNQKIWAERSARAYEDAFARHASPYVQVNAATMWLLAGQGHRATQIASRVLGTEPPPTDDGDENKYWDTATEAEAALILGDVGRAGDALRTAGSLSVGNHAARASTLRQLRIVCRLLDIDPSVLRPIQNPAVIHYCGHRIGGEEKPTRFPPDRENWVRGELTKALDHLDVGYGFGSLAAGTDILAAEALLDRGAELQVLLPFDRAEFVRTSVAPAGTAWVERFERCLSAASGVVTTVSSEFLDDPVLFDFCAQVAMGDALIRARFLATEAHQVAVWDGVPTGDVAGTAIDVARWREGGRITTVIPVDSGWIPNGGHLAARRQIRAVVFGDFAGFSALSDAQVMTFREKVLAGLAAEVERFRSQLLHGNTWGDALYLVFDDVASAANCALTIQDVIRTMDFAGLGLKGLRGMRIAAHAAPVFEGWDPIALTRTFFGAGVTQTARIEPQTPEGDVYVTYPFAALASLGAHQSFDCQYVGQLAAAKGYGNYPLFALRRAHN